MEAGSQIIILSFLFIIILKMLIGCPTMQSVSFHKQKAFKKTTVTEFPKKSLVVKDIKVVLVQKIIV